MKTYKTVSRADLANSRSLSTAEQNALFLRAKQSEEEAQRALSMHYVKMEATSLGNLRFGCKFLTDLFGVCNEVLQSFLSSLDAARLDAPLCLDAKMKEAVAVSVVLTPASARVRKTAERKWAKAAIACSAAPNRRDTYVYVEGASAMQSSSVSTTGLVINSQQYGVADRVESQCVQSDSLQTAICAVGKKCPSYYMDILMASYGLKSKTEIDKIATTYDLSAKKISAIGRVMEIHLQRYLRRHSSGFVA